MLGQTVPLRELASEGPVEVYLRPENLRLVGRPRQGVDTVVVESSFLGSFRRTVVQTADGALVRVQHPATDAIVVGDGCASACCRSGAGLLDRRGGPDRRVRPRRALSPGSGRCEPVGPVSLRVAR